MSNSVRVWPVKAKNWTGFSAYSLYLLMGDLFSLLILSVTILPDLIGIISIEIILLNWRAFESWLTDPIYRELKEAFVEDYACFVTEIVKFLSDEGVKISYLEPTNEPDGTTDTKIPPSLYNTFVKLLREYLDDEEGLTEVKILGPGLAYLNHDDTCGVYLQALDPMGVEAISA